MASSICRVKYTDRQDSHQFSLDVGRVVRQLTASWCMVLLLSRLFGSLDVNLWCFGIVPLINRINLVLSCCRCIVWLCQWISPNSRHHILEIFQLLVPFVLCSVSCELMLLFFLLCAHCSTASKLIIQDPGFMLDLWSSRSLIIQRCKRKLWFQFLSFSSFGVFTPCWPERQWPLNWAFFHWKFSIYILNTASNSCTIFSIKAARPKAAIADEEAALPWSPQSWKM